MESVSSAFFDSQHPLAEDRERLERIAHVMYATIQKALYWVSHGVHSTRGQLLEGTGVGADDILADALGAVLRYPPERLEGEWEALAERIARNKAVDAYRASQKGLRATEHRDRLHLVSGDAERESADGEKQAPLLEVLPSDWDGPDIEYERAEMALVLRDLAREVLDEREQKILFATLFKGDSRKKVGGDLELTGQRVSQILLDAVNRLATHPNNPFTSEGVQEGGDNDDRT